MKQKNIAQWTCIILGGLILQAMIFMSFTGESVNISVASSTVNTAMNSTMLVATR